MQPTPLVRQGWLEKTGTGIMSSTKNRWFTLDQLGMLTYYKDETMTDKKGSYDITKAQSLQYDSDKTLKLKIKNRTYEFHAISKSKALAWESEFRNFISFSYENNGTLLRKLRSQTMKDNISPNSSPNSLLSNNSNTPKTHLKHSKSHQNNGRRRRSSFANIFSSSPKQPNNTIKSNQHQRQRRMSNTELLQQELLMDLQKRMAKVEDERDNLKQTNIEINELKLEFRQKENNYKQEISNLKKELHDYRNSKDLISQKDHQYIVQKLTYKYETELKQLKISQKHKRDEWEEDLRERLKEKEEEYELKYNIKKKTSKKPLSERLLDDNNNIKTPLCICFGLKLF